MQDLLLLFHRWDRRLLSFQKFYVHQKDVILSTVRYNSEEQDKETITRYKKHHI